MRVVIAGTVHQDPLCRQALRQMFAARKTAEGASPRFVAVESDPGHFEEIRSLRPKFKLKARDACPELSDSVIDELSLTMLFEADTHGEFFPDVEVIWLDRGRVPKCKSDVSQFDDGRLAFYRPLFENRRSSGAGFEASSVLRYLSSSAKLGVADGPPCRDPQRDMRWYHEMLPYLDRATSAEWGIVVCGVEHGRAENGNLAELLELSGHVVEFEDLARVFS